MGKGYNNFMSKKAFHPGSFANQKRIHEAEARAEAKRKHDEETLAQYQKEQELFNQKSLVSKQSKEKLSLSFMYEVPAGVEKPGEKQSDKVEWTGSSGRAIQGSNKPAPGANGQTICLEWKREKPVRNAKKADSESVSDIKKESDNKSKLDLSFKRESKTTRPIEDTKPFVKRIKKEL